MPFLTDGDATIIYKSVETPPIRWSTTCLHARRKRVRKFVEAATSSGVPGTRYACQKRVKLCTAASKAKIKSLSDSCASSIVNSSG